MRAHRDYRQVPLWPLRLFEPSSEKVQICASCGKQIIVRRRVAEGSIISEYVSASGRCWDCTFGKPAA